MKKRILTTLIAVIIAAAVFCTAASAAGLFSFINDNAEPPKGEMQAARIEKIADGSVTLTLGELKRDENTNPSDSFVAGNEKVELKVEDNSKLENLKAGDIVFVRYNDQNVLEDIHSVNDMKDHKGPRGKLARIDKITDKEITLTLNAVPEESTEPGEDQKPDENTELDKKPAENFTGEQITLTYSDKDLSVYKAGDVVFVDYNDQNVLEKISKADEMKKDGKVGRIDEISDDKITLTLGELERKDENADSNDGFVAGTEKVTLTADSELLSGLKAGDIVFVKYNDQNVVEDIHSADRKGGSHGGDLVRIDQITDGSIVVTPGKLERKDDQDENTEKQAPNPEEDFVAGTEKLTLSVPDTLKEELKNYKSGSIVSVKYNDKNELEEIHAFDAMKPHGRGHGRGFDGQNSDQPQDKAQNTQNQNTQNSNQKTTASFNA